MPNKTESMSMVVRITPSPMTQGLWKLDLDCGHAPWVRSKRKPSMARRLCPACYALAIIHEKKGSPTNA